MVQRTDLPHYQVARCAGTVDAATSAVLFCGGKPDGFARSASSSSSPPPGLMASGDLSAGQ